MALDAHPGQALHRKLMYSVRPKCHPLLLDEDLNSRESILLNVYQLFLLTAKKFLVYAKELPRGKSSLIARLCNRDLREVVKATILEQDSPNHKIDGGLCLHLLPQPQKMVLYCIASHPPPPPQSSSKR